MMTNMLKYIKALNGNKRGVKFKTVYFIESIIHSLKIPVDSKYSFTRLYNLCSKWIHACEKMVTVRYLRAGFMFFEPIEYANNKKELTNLNQLCIKILQYLNFKKIFTIKTLEDLKKYLV